MNHRVLVVDDNAAIHEDIRKILATEPDTSARIRDLEAELFEGHAARDVFADVQFDIHAAYQGQEALELVRQAVAEGRPYSLAFVDVRMPPGWDGIETIERLWQEDAHIQTVIISAYSEYTVAEIAGRLGATDRLLIIKKPFDNVEIQMMAHTLTRKYSLERALRLKLADLDALVRQRTSALERKQAELAHAGKMAAIGQLVAGIAHEINTPIQYVGDNTYFLQGAFAELLKVQPSTRPARLEYLVEQIPKALAQSVEGIAQVSSIVQAMRTFVHPGTSDAKENVDLHKSIEAAIMLAKHEWKQVAEVSTDFDPALPLVPCRRGQFNQVLLNLLINAAHAIAEDVVARKKDAKGTITVKTRAEDGWATISVIDTGTGIPEAVRSRVFEPFFTTKEPGKGTGQGLSLVHSLITAGHGGTVTFETEGGKGTTFIVRLPLRA